MPHYVASDLGLHFLPNTPLGVSSIKRVKGSYDKQNLTIVYISYAIYETHRRRNLYISYYKTE